MVVVKCPYCGNEYVTSEDPKYADECKKCGGKKNE